MKKKRILRAVWRTALLVFLAFAVGIGVYSFNVRTFTGSNLAMPFGVGAAVVISGSMEPSLSVGDLIIVREAEEYSLHEIVVFETEGSLVVHEIVRFEDGMVITRGSANNTDDPPIPPESIRGKVVATIPAVGFALDVIRSLPGTLLIIALSLFLYFRSWKGEKAEDDERRQALLSEIERLRREQSQNDEPKE